MCHYIYRCIVEGWTFYFGVLLPVVIIMVINIIILIIVIYKIQNSMKQKLSEKQPIDRAITLLRIVVACSVLLGLTWLFGVLAVGSMSETFQYLFCIFNSLQGFFIFFFYTLTNKDVKNEWKRILRRESNLTVKTTSM